MKVIIDKSFFVLWFIGIAFMSCETTEETFEEFVRDGEAIVTGKPVGVTITPGRERARFSIIINADPKITKGFIEWEKSDGALDNREYRVVRSKSVQGRDTLKVEINQIEEGTRAFSFIMGDDDGRKSIPVQVTAVIYGSVYESNLLARGIAGVETFPDSSALVTWRNAIPGLVETTFSFRDKAGVSQEIVVDNSDTETEIPGYDPAFEYSVASSFQPEPSTLDLFTAQKTAKFPPIKVALDRSLIQYIQLTGDSDLGNGDFSLAAALDGNPDTPGLISPFEFPNHFSLDLGVTVNLNEVELTPFSCCGGTFDIMPKVFQVWGIADTTNAIPVTSPRGDNDNDGVMGPNDFAEDYPIFEQEFISKGWVKLIDANANGDGLSPVIEAFESNEEVRYIRFICFDTFRHASGGNTDTGMNNITFRFLQ